MSCQPAFPQCCHIQTDGEVVEDRDTCDGSITGCTFTTKLAVNAYAFLSPETTIREALNVLSEDAASSVSYTLVEGLKELCEEIDVNEKQKIPQLLLQQRRLLCLENDKLEIGSKQGEEQFSVGGRPKLVLGDWGSGEGCTASKMLEMISGQANTKWEGLEAFQCHAVVAGVLGSMNTSREDFWKEMKKSVASQLERTKNKMIYKISFIFILLAFALRFFFEWYA